MLKLKNMVLTFFLETKGKKSSVQVCTAILTLILTAVG